MMQAAAASAAASARGPRATSDYAELKRRICDAGLLKRQHRDYAARLAVTSALLILSVSLFFFLDNEWLLLAFNAPFLAFVFGQFGLLWHDAWHGQFFERTRWNEVAGVMLGYVIGFSRSWWLEKHNAHHANPNQAELDPDIDIPALAFSEEQALEKTGLGRFLVKRQAALFLPLLFLQAFALRVASIRFLMKNRPRHPVHEPLAMLLLPALLLALLFSTMPFGHAIAFFLVSEACLGFYLGSVFAPNHKGMPVLPAGTEVDFLRRQVLTARNVRPSPLVDLWYGGLNYQIEHHLFPCMPRRHFRDARKIVKAFCAEKGIPYYETGVLDSYREIIEHLHEIAAFLRRNDARRGNA